MKLLTLKLLFLICIKYVPLERFFCIMFNLNLYNSSQQFNDLDGSETDACVPPFLLA